MTKKIPNISWKFRKFPKFVMLMRNNVRKIEQNVTLTKNILNILWEIQKIPEMCDAVRKQFLINSKLVEHF
jgi:hypothetical protein